MMEDDGINGESRDLKEVDSRESDTNSASFQKATQIAKRGNVFGSSNCHQLVDTVAFCCALERKQSLC
jgi:hypothetical protein